jgi:hypothetical protein
MPTFLAVMIYWLYGTWLSGSILTLNVVLCGLLTSQLYIVHGVNMIQFQHISISHMNIETEYCTWNNMWYSFSTSVYFTCILKQNIVHGVNVIQFQHISISHICIETEYCTWSECDTVSEHHYISNEYWNRILYME